jgi:hypothetical protein
MDFEQFRQEYYTFKEVVEDDEGNPCLETPHHDPMEYEFSINFIFETPEKAIAWLDTDADCWGLEPEEYEDWVLVKITEEVVI